nr:hypothetical protein [Paenibacillus xylanexedens]
MKEATPKNVEQASMESLIQKLNLPPLTPFSQDWEYTSADASRLDEFITYYENHQLNDNEKFTLMIIMISSLDDYLSEGKGTDGHKLWNRIKQNLRKDYELHIHTINYWAQDESDLEDCFAVTPYVREMRTWNEGEYDND